MNNLFDRILDAVNKHGQCHVRFSTLNKFWKPGESRQDTAKRIARLNSWNFNIYPNSKEVVFKKKCG